MTCKVVIGIVLAVAVLLTIVDDILVLLHCEPGYLGYPDRWDKPIYKKISLILCAVSLVLLAADLICALFIL